MTVAWVAIVGLTVATLIVKAAAPVLLGGRQLAPRGVSVVAPLPPASWPRSWWWRP